VPPKAHANATQRSIKNRSVGVPRYPDVAHNDRVRTMDVVPSASELEAATPKRNLSVRDLDDPVRGGGGGVITVPLRSCWLTRQNYALDPILTKLVDQALEEWDAVRGHVRLHDYQLLHAAPSARGATVR